MSDSKLIKIVTDYTEYPGGRYRKHGPGSGEEFRERILIPNLKTGKKLVVDLTGASGYPSSFLEEAFGGLVRAGFSPDKLNEVLHIQGSGSYAPYAAIAQQYIIDAGIRENKNG